MPHTRTLRSARTMLLGLIFAAVLMLCSAVATPAAHANVNPKHWWLIVQNDSKARMAVCREWGKASDPWHCNPKYGVRYLNPGQRTDQAFGWKDTDGVWIPATLQLKRNQPGKNPVLGSAGKYNGVMLKMSPRLSSYNRGDLMGLYYVKNPRFR